MKNKLQQLAPVLEGFNVRVKDGKVLSKPEYDKDVKGVYDTYKFQASLAEHKIKKKTYNQAQTLCKMPKVMGFVDYLNEQGVDFVYAARYVNLATPPPQLGHYIPCDKEGKPLEEPPQWCESWEFKKKQEVSRANEAYRLALDRVIFSGWEVMYIGNGFFNIHNASGVVLSFHKGKLLYKDEIITNYEDAFIACPHYVDLTKLK